MATAEQPLTGNLQGADLRGALAGQWRNLSRAATAVAILTSPATFLWFHEQQEFGLWLSLLLTFIVVIAFRGLVDLIFRRSIP